MKKIALFVASVCLLIGVASAQEPVKKDQKENTPNKVVTARPANTPNVQAQHHDCGHCPHHAAAQSNTNQRQLQPKDAQHQNCNGQHQGCNQHGTNAQRQTPATNTEVKKGENKK